MGNTENIIQLILILVVLLGVLFLKKHHVKEMKENENISSRGIIKNYAIAIYTLASAMVLISFIESGETILTLYILLPIAISGLYILYLGDEKIYAFYYIIKGVSYFGLALFTATQLVGEQGDGNVARYAAGMSIAVAIIEGFTACTDGIRKVIQKNSKC